MPEENTSQPIEVPHEHYTKEYFDRWNYADRPLGKYSMYWFARRYFAHLIRRYAPEGGSERKLLEMGCGLGHLLGLLEDEFDCTGIDLIDYSIEQSRINAPKSKAIQGDATDFSIWQDGELSVVVALHLVEHLPDPQKTLKDIYRTLRSGGLLFFATPHPEYTFRKYKDRENDAIGKDKTHINCHVPEVWKVWGEESGFEVLKQFGDGLWDVPYWPVIPKSIQFALFGAPAFLQVISRTTLIPTAWGVNQINIMRKP